MGESKLDQLSDHDDSADMSESIRRARWDARTIDPDEVMVSTSIRLPRTLMERVRELAAEAGVPATTLVRQWIMDRVTARPEETVVSVADLERFIAERSYPAA